MRNRDAKIILWIKLLIIFTFCPLVDKSTVFHWFPFITSSRQLKAIALSSSSQVRSEATVGPDGVEPEQMQLHTEFFQVDDCPECHPVGLFFRNFIVVAIIPLGGLQTLLSTKPVAKQSAYRSKKFITLEENNPLIWFKPGLEVFCFFLIKTNKNNSQNKKKANKK